MKALKYFLGTVFALTMVASSPALAQVAGSSHDLSTPTEEICVYCHTPHNGDVAGTAPLWNRVNNTTPGAFTMYDSPTIDMTIAGDPQDVSLACLSCHDGVTAYNNILQGTASNIGVMSGARAIGLDAAGLGNDHPISITYDETVDTAFNADDATVPNFIGGLPLYGVANDQVECATCHNPHDTTNGSFLRATNVQSSLCTTCHIK